MSLEDKIKIIRNEEGEDVVQMNLDVFQAIQSYIEDEGLLKLMLETDKKEYLEKSDALKFYSELKKEN
jgi:hypothetical protein